MFPRATQRLAQGAPRRNLLELLKSSAGSRNKRKICQRQYLINGPAKQHLDRYQSKRASPLGKPKRCCFEYLVVFILSFDKWKRAHQLAFEKCATLEWAQRIHAASRESTPIAIEFDCDRRSLANIISASQSIPICNAWCQFDWKPIEWFMMNDGDDSICANRFFLALFPRQRAPLIEKLMRWQQCQNLAQPSAKLARKKLATAQLAILNWSQRNSLDELNQNTFVHLQREFVAARTHYHHDSHTEKQTLFHERALWMQCKLYPLLGHRKHAPPTITSRIGSLSPFLPSTSTHCDNLNLSCQLQCQQIGLKSII